jgi:hypothetical protein
MLCLLILNKSRWHQSGENQKGGRGARHVKFGSHCYIPLQQSGHSVGRNIGSDNLHSREA